MEVTGVCADCGAHGLVKTCVLCGRLVCRDHHDAATGACARCARRPPATKPAPRAPPADPPPGPEDAGGRYT